MEISKNQWRSTGGQSCLKSKQMLYIFGGRDSAISYLSVQHEGQFLLHISFFLLTLGPPLPKFLREFSMLEINGDTFIFGGYGASYNSYNSVIYQLTCSSGSCSWSTLNQGLKVARYLTAAILVPDTFCV